MPKLPPDSRHLTQRMPFPVIAWGSGIVGLASWKEGFERATNRRARAVVHSQYEDRVVSHVVDHAIAVYKDFTYIRSSNLRDHATC
jgi:hypothetical protein